MTFLRFNQFLVTKFRSGHYSSVPSTSLLSVWGGYLMIQFGMASFKVDMTLSGSFTYFKFPMCSIFRLLILFKGQLISKCPYEKLVSSKIPTKLFLDFCPGFFLSFLGASWKLFGLPVGFLIYDIIY